MGFGPVGLPRSCIIGAGCSGFATAKALKDRGLPFDCFDMSSVIGGNWVYKNPNGRSACYQSLHIDTSKHRMQFEDFPIPETYPDYPHHSQIADYFNAYVDTLRPARRHHAEYRSDARGARRRCTVACRAVEWRDAAHYDALFVCNGHHWDPYIPDFPGTFDGIEMHAHSYLTPFEPHDMRGKRVLVVGMGNSAMDIASELSQKPIAKKLFVAARRGRVDLPEIHQWRAAGQRRGAQMDAGLAGAPRRQEDDRQGGRPHAGLRPAGAGASSGRRPSFGLRRVPDARRLRRHSPWSRTSRKSAGTRCCSRTAARKRSTSSSMRRATTSPSPSSTTR